MIIHLSPNLLLLALTKFPKGGRDTMFRWGRQFDIVSNETFGLSSLKDGMVITMLCVKETLDS